MTNDRELVYHSRWKAADAAVARLREENDDLIKNICTAPLEACQARFCSELSPCRVCAWKKRIGYHDLLESWIEKSNRASAIEKDIEADIAKFAEIRRAGAGLVPGLSPRCYGKGEKAVGYTTGIGWITEKCPGCPDCASGEEE